MTNEKIQHTLKNGQTVELDAMPISEGDYKLRVDTVDVAKSRAGDEMIKVKYGFVTKDEKLSKKALYGNYLMEYAAFNPSSGKKNPAEIGKGQIDNLLKALGHEDGFEVLDEDTSKLEDLIMGESFIGSVKDDNKPYTNPSTGKTYLNSRIAKFSSK